MGGLYPEGQGRGRSSTFRRRACGVGGACREQGAQGEAHPSNMGCHGSYERFMRLDLDPLFNQKWLHKCGNIPTLSCIRCMLRRSVVGMAKEALGIRGVELEPRRKAAARHESSFVAAHVPSYIPLLVASFVALATLFG